MNKPNLEQVALQNLVINFEESQKDMSIKSISTDNSFLNSFIEIENKINEDIEKYSNICSYKSPNIKNAFIKDDEIHFFTSRYVGSSQINDEAVFNLDGNVKKISPYESEYIINSENINQKNTLKKNR